MHRIPAQARLHLRKFYGNYLGYALFFHRHAEKRIGVLHRRLAVGDYYELRFGRELFEVFCIPAYVGLVEGGLDFVEHAEGHRAHTYYGKQYGYRRERTLAARKQGYFGELFAGRARNNLYARVERVFAVGVVEFKLCPAAAEQLFEGLFEVFVYLGEAVVEDIQHLLPGFRRGRRSNRLSPSPYRPCRRPSCRSAP